LVTTFLRTDAIRGFRLLFIGALVVGLAVDVGLGAGLGVYLGFGAVRFPVITNSPSSTVKSIQVLLQSAAKEKALPGKVKISAEIIRVEKTLKASSRRSATYSHFV
jgi:hypothetical protein